MLIDKGERVVPRRRKSAGERDYTKLVSIVFHTHDTDGEVNKEIQEFDKYMDLFQEEMGFTMSRAQFVMHLLKHYRDTNKLGIK